MNRMKYKGENDEHWNNSNRRVVLIRVRARPISVSILEDLKIQ